MNQPPFNGDAEESVLGAMMLSALAVETVLAELEPDGEQTFWRETHGHVYRACRALYRAQRPVDAITVAALLESKGKLADAGGKERIHELAALVPATSNVGHYAKIVREMWAKRLVAAAALQGHESAINGAGSAETIEATLNALLDVQATLGRGRKRPALLGELALRLEDRVKNPPKECGIATPFPTFPKFQPSRLYVLSGYTKDGKTAVACQFAAAAAKHVPVGFVSIEMSDAQLFDRMVAGFGVPLHMVESGRITPPFLPAYREGLRVLSGLNVEVIDDPGACAATIAPLQRARKYGLIIVDHLHRISLGGKASERRHFLEDEVRDLARLTRSEEVPMLLLAQLSRSGTPGNPYPRPNASMLRETAVIEQEAAVVAFVYRKRDTTTHEPTDDAEMIVQYDRFGPSGSFPLRFLGEQMRYVELQEAAP